MDLAKDLFFFSLYLKPYLNGSKHAKHPITLNVNLVKFNFGLSCLNESICLSYDSIHVPTG